MQEVLLEGRRNGALARCRQARQPERGALLPQQAAPLIVGDMPLVEGDVGGHVCFYCCCLAVRKGALVCV